MHFEDEKFTGTVMQIRLSPETTSNVVTYTVIINAPNPDQKLLPGMTADLVIYVEETNDVLVIPYKAVKFTPEADYLARIGKEMMSTGSIPGTDPQEHPESRQQGVPSGQMPEGATLPAGFKMPTMVWVRR